MNFKMLKEGQKWEDLYYFLTFPKEIKNDKENNIDEQKENIIPKISSIFHPNSQKKFEQNSRSYYSPPKDRLYSGRVKDDIVVVKQSKKNISEKMSIPEHNSFLKLSHSLGFSGKFCPDIKWMNLLENNKEIAYASGSLVVVNNVEANSNRFFFGHNESIVCLDLSKDNQYLVSAQDEKKCLIKLWTPKDGICVSTIQPPYETIKSVSFSSQQKTLLCSVGTDHLKRQLIIIWDIDNIINKKKVIFYC